MSNFNDREKAFENKFALDEALLFKAEARCCKLFGLWLAEKLEMPSDEAQSFAGDVVASNLQESGFSDVKRFIAPYIANHAISEDEIDTKLGEFFIRAQEQIKTEVK